MRFYLLSRIYYDKKEYYMLKELYSLSHIDTERIEKDIEAIVNLSSTLCNTSASSIHLFETREYYIDKSKNWINSNTSKNHKLFCDYVIKENINDIFIINDTRKDSRFEHLEEVKNNSIIFYAGVRLKNLNGNTIGTLFVVDNQPKELSERQKDGLKLLGRQMTHRLEEHRNKIKLQQLKNELQNKNEQLRNFAGVVSHDMKMPLANMILTCDLLRAKYKGVIDEEGSNYLHRMKQSSLILSEYITNILQHYESDQVAEMAIEEFYLHDLLENTIDILNIQEECDINLPENNLKVIGNQVALGQIFINLITNSLKYNDKEKIVIDIECSEDNDYYHFSVRDNGIGISKDQLTKIFHLFQTFGQIDRNGNVGNGIGLSTVRKLIMGLGGDIEVESRLGKSTTFYFHIEHP